MEGSKPTHGKGNRVLHPEPLSEKSGAVPPQKRGKVIEFCTLEPVPLIGDDWFSLLFTADLGHIEW